MSDTDPITRLNAALEGRYRIESELGEGGMATVYLADDIKHERKVALKVLKPELAAVVGAERFLAEIKTTANLQHPNILPLFDSGEADSQVFYVMPYVEGESLRDKLDREHQLPVDEAVRITSEVADGLQAAHEQGVVHRDIKPANIMLSRGRPLIADFGIALAVSAAGGTRLTETGLSLGTPYYMSPEQATGDQATGPATDTYALACVLYELLVGEPPYTGSTAQAILGKIIMGGPVSATETRASVPANVDAAIRKALEKLPADRFASAQDFAKALADPGFRHGELVAVGAAPGAGPWNRLAVGFATTTVLAALALGWALLRPAALLPVARDDLVLGAITPDVRGGVVISPDGTMLAAVGTVADGEQAIYLRHSDESDFAKVPGTDGARSVSFSPAGDFLAFWGPEEGVLLRIPTAGGGATALVAGDSAGGAWPHWGEDGTVVYSTRRGDGYQGFYRVQGTGGPRQLLSTSFALIRNPHLLPDGSGVLGVGQDGIHFVDLANDTSWMLIAGGSHPTYVETGHILYVPPDGGLYAVPFDLDEPHVIGTPTLILDRVASTDFRGGYSVSRNGTLVYLEGESSLVGFGSARSNTRFMLHGPDGADSLPLRPGAKYNPRFSPDGRSIAYFAESGTGGGGQRDIYAFDLVTGLNPRLTFEGFNFRPVWSPDGTRLLFSSYREGVADSDLFVKPADNSSDEIRVRELPEDQFALTWLEDDLVVFSSGSEGSWDLLTLRLSDGAEPEPYLEARWDENDFALSPNGSLAAVVTNETGTNEVWLRDFPVPEGNWQVSFGGGRVPRWSPDGQTLYYMRYSPDPRIPDTIFAVSVETEPSVVIGDPQVLLAANLGSVNWDLDPDGERIIVIESTRNTMASSPERYLIVRNWLFRELQSLQGN